MHVTMREVQALEQVLVLAPVMMMVPSLEAGSARAGAFVC